MTDLLTQIHFNNINPIEQLDKIMEKAGLNTFKTLKQVEELTGIKADNLRQRINRGTLKATKIGRDWMISTKTLKTLDDNRKT